MGHFWSRVRIAYHLCGLKLGKPAIAPAMLWPLLVMLAAYGLLALLVILLRTRNEILERKLNG